MKGLFQGGRRFVPAGALLALALGACGGSTTNTTPTTIPTTTTTTTTPRAAVVVQGSQGLQKRQVYFFDVTTTQKGRIDVTVDYAFADSQILLWLTDRQCSFVLFDRDACDYLVKSLDGPKPRTMFAPSVAPGIYTVFVANDGPYDEQLTYKVTLTPSTGMAGRITPGRSSLVSRP